MRRSAGVPPTMSEFHFVDEPDEWAAMTPQQRWAESSTLWEFYLSMGGSLDPEPDSQSPFDFEELQRAVPPLRRAGVHPLRRD